MKYRNVLVLYRHDFLFKTYFVEGNKFLSRIQGFWERLGIYYEKV